MFDQFYFFHFLNRFFKFLFSIKMMTQAIQSEQRTTNQPTSQQLENTNIMAIVMGLKLQDNGQIMGPLTDFEQVISTIKNIFETFKSCAITCDNLPDIIDSINDLNNTYYVEAYKIAIKLAIIKTALKDLTGLTDFAANEDIKNRLTSQLVDEIKISIDIDKALKHCEKVESIGRGMLANIGKYSNKEDKRKEARNLKQQAETVKIALDLFKSSEDWDPYDLDFIDKFDYILINLLKYYVIIIATLNSRNILKRKDFEEIKAVYGYLFNNLNNIIDNYLISVDGFYEDHTADLAATCEEILSNIEPEEDQEEQEEDEETARVLNALYYFIYDLKNDFKHCLENGQTIKEIAKSLNLDELFNYIYNYNDIKEDLLNEFINDFYKIRHGTSYFILKLNKDL